MVVCPGEILQYRLNYLLPCEVSQKIEFYSWKDWYNLSKLSAFPLLLVNFQKTCSWEASTGMTLMPKSFGSFVRNTCVFMHPKFFFYTKCYEFIALKIATVNFWFCKVLSCLWNISYDFL